MDNNSVTSKKESLDRIADSLHSIDRALHRLVTQLEQGNGGVIALGGGTPLPPGGDD